jgi:hypothetical protein
MHLIRRKTEITNSKIVETTEIVIPLKEKTIKKGVVRKKILGIPYSKEKNISDIFFSNSFI